jgi:hypothetical protein
VLLIVLTLIIAVATVNMVSALTMTRHRQDPRDRDPQVDGRAVARASA